MDWNGSGMHANFSNTILRTCGDKDVYAKICEAFRPVVKEHIEVYGEFNDQRLTGLHETAAITDFSWGVSDRGASIRIPIIAVEPVRQCKHLLINPGIKIVELAATATTPRARTGTSWTMSIRAAAAT